MSMKTQADIYKALLDGKTVITKEGNKVKMIDGRSHEYRDSSKKWIPASWFFTGPEDWSIYEEPPKTKKFYTWMRVDCGYGFMPDTIYSEDKLDTKGTPHSNREQLIKPIGEPIELPVDDKGAVLWDKVVTK